MTYGAVVGCSSSSAETVAGGGGSSVPSGLVTSSCFSLRRAVPVACQILREATGDTGERVGRHSELESALPQVSPAAARR